MLQTGAVRFRNEESGRETTVESDIAIGADGAASAIRLEMLKLGPLQFLAAVSRLRI